jgi:hypothetical protein
MRRSFEGQTGGAVLLGLVLVLLSVHMLGYAHLDTDDAYISFRYARNLVRGHGLVFNPGERVEGYTNFLWTVLMAPAIAVGLAPILWARVLGFLSALACVLLLAWAASDRRRGWAPGLWLAVHPAWAYWAVAGLETVFFGTLATAAVLLWLRWDRPALAGVVFLAAALTRPEGALLFGLCVAAGLVTRPRELRRELRRALRGVVVFAPLFGAYLLLRRSYYGFWLPNTYYAKTGGDPRWSEGLGYILEHARGGWWLIYGLALLGALRGLRRRRGQLALALVVVGYLAYVAWTGGDWMAHSRFIVPIMPLTAHLAAEGLARRSRRRPAWMVEAPVSVVLVLALVWSGGETLREELRLPWVGAEESGPDVLVELGRYLAANTPPDAVLAVVPAGKIPFYADRYTIDMRGLADVHIAHQPVLSRGLTGHEKRAPEYVLSRRPDVIVTTGARLKPARRRALKLEEGPRQMVLDTYPILKHPRFRREYEPVLIPLERGDKDLFFYRRKRRAAGYQEEELRPAAPSPPGRDRG